MKFTHGIRFRRDVSCFAITLLLLSALTVARADETTKCDLLVANPNDSAKIADGIDWENINAKKAVKACKKALKIQPQEARLMYQYGRALHKSENLKEAKKWYQKAAKNGYVRAMQTLGVMYEKGMGVKKDVAKANKWNQKAKAAERDLAKTNEPAKVTTTKKKESTFAKNNPLYDNEYDKLHGDAIYKGYAEPIYWFKLPSRVRQHSSYTDLKLVPFVGINFGADRKGGIAIKNNIAIGNVQKVLSKEWFKEGKATIGGRPDLNGRNFDVKIDEKGRPFSIEKSKGRQLYVADVPVGVENSLEKILESIVFQPIYGQFSHNPERIFRIQVSLIWSQDSLTSTKYEKNIRPEIIREKRRIAAVEKQYKTEIAQAKLEKLHKQNLASQEKVRQAKLASQEKARVDLIATQGTQRKQVLDRHIAPGKQSVIWSSGPAETSRYSSNDVFFNQLNQKYHAASRLSGTQQAFSAPKKGEFEKSDAYNARVAKERANHKKLMLKRSQALAADRSKILEKLLNEELGKPTITSIKYNADQEKFIIGISSPTRFSIQVALPHPIDEAPRLKKEIESSKPWVVFSFDSKETLQLVTVILQHGTTTLETSPASQFAVAMSDEKLKAHDLKLAKVHEANKLRWAKEKKENDRLRAERRKTWPANTIGVMEVGTVACLSHKSVYRAIAIKRANNSYVAQAADCFNIVNKAYLSSIQNTQTGISRVLWHGARAEVFVDESDITQ